MNSKTSKGKKNSNIKSDEQETQWTDLANNKAIEEEKKEESEEEDEEFEVELIFDKMIKKGTVYYKVKWKNYSKDDATWEPEANLDNAPLKIREYENQELAKKNKDKQPETPKEAAKEAAKEAPKEVPKETKPEVSIKAEDQEEKDKKEAAKKAVTPKLPVVTEPESVTGKRDRKSLEDDASKSKQEDKASKTKKEKSGKKKPGETEKSSDKKPTKKKSETQEKSQSDNEEETINKMRKLSPKGAGQPQAQIIPTQDGAAKGISGSSTDKNNLPSTVKYTPKDTPIQNPAEKEKIEKIYDQIFAQAKQGQTQPTPTPGKTNPPSQAMVEEKDSKNNSVAKAPQQQSQEMNKGISLSKIMQDEKLMELSETESQNRSEVQENDKKDQASDTAGASKTKKKGRSEYGALEKGDIPLKVVGIRPVKEDKDLEIMISWKTREDGVKPYNSKVMRIDLLKSGFYMPLIEFYESKMKLEGAPTFDPASLPKV